MPERPRMMPPVGKSGPGMSAISSAVSRRGLSISAIVASITSPRLCGGMLVAMPTAMPPAAVDEEVREARRQDRRLLRRNRRSWRGSRRCSCRGRRAANAPLSAGALRCSASAAGGSPSSEPKLPCPSMSGRRMEKVLRHAHQRVVDRLVAMRVIFADDVADDARRFAVGLVPVVAALVHRVEDAPMHRLQAVAHVGKRAADDHAHRVIDVGPAHLVGDGDRLDVAVAAARRVLLSSAKMGNRLLLIYAEASISIGEWKRIFNAEKT